MKHQGLSEKPIPFRVNKYMNKMKKLAQAAKERVKQRKEKEQTGDVDDTDEQGEAKNEVNTKLMERQATGFVKKL